MTFTSKVLATHTNGLASQDYQQLRGGRQFRLEDAHLWFQHLPPCLIGLQQLGQRQEGEPDATYLRRIRQDTQNFIRGSSMTILLNGEDVTNAYLADEPEAAMVARLEEVDPSRQLVVQIHLPDRIQPDPPQVPRLRAREAPRRRRRRTGRRLSDNEGEENNEGPREGAISRAMRRHIEPRVCDPNFNMQGSEIITRARKRALKGRAFLVRYLEDNEEGSDEDSEADNESNEDGTWEIVSSSVQGPENIDPEGTDNPEAEAGPSGTGNKPVDGEETKEEPTANVDEEPHAQIEEQPADADEQPQADFGEEPVANVEEEPPGNLQEEPAEDEGGGENGEEPHAQVEEQPANGDEQPPADFDEEPVANVEEDPPGIVQEEPAEDEGGADNVEERNAQVEEQPANGDERPPAEFDEEPVANVEEEPPGNDQDEPTEDEGGTDNDVTKPCSAEGADNDLAKPCSAEGADNDLAKPCNAGGADNGVAKPRNAGGADEPISEASTPIKKKRKKRGMFRLTMPKRCQGKKGGQRKKRLPQSLRMNASGLLSDEE